MEQTPRVEEGPGGLLYTPERVDGLEFLRAWKKLNPSEYERVVDHQRQNAQEAAALAEEDTQSNEGVPEQAQESAQQQIYRQSTEGGRSPFQQQTRQMHTSNRRLISGQRPTSFDFKPPVAKDWLS